MEGSPSHRWRLEIESGGYSPWVFPAWREGKLSQTSDRLYSAASRTGRPYSSATGAGEKSINSKLQKKIAKKVLNFSILWC